MKQIIFTTGLFLLSFSIFASVSESIDLTTVSNDITKEVSILGINESNGEIDSFYLTTFLNGEEVEHSEFDANLIYEGVVIMEMDGRKVISLKSEEFDLTEGGVITVKYLYSGLTKKYKKVDIILDKDDGWALYTSDENYFDHIFCKGNKVFGKPVGIKKIYFEEE